MWWTTANRIADAYAGFARRIDSSARQAERGTIGGAPAAASARDGTCRRRGSRRCTPEPRRRGRASAPGSGPTHRPTRGCRPRQPPRRRTSALDASGASSASGATGRQGAPAAPSERVRKLTPPEPRQWKPIIVNGRECVRAWTLSAKRDVDSGDRPRAPPHAPAPQGKAAATRTAAPQRGAARRKGGWAGRGHGGGFRVAKTPFAHKSGLPCLTESLQRQNVG